MQEAISVPTSVTHSATKVHATSIRQNSLHILPHSTGLPSRESTVLPGKHSVQQIPEADIMDWVSGNVDYSGKIAGTFCF